MRYPTIIADRIKSEQPDFIGHGVRFFIFDNYRYESYMLVESFPYLYLFESFED